MIGIEEYREYKDKVTSEDTKSTLLSDNASLISKLESELCIIYSRLSFEVARVKDAIDQKLIGLINEGMAVNKAEVKAEQDTNAGSLVTRRDLEALHKSVDKLSFSCTHRTKIIIAERQKEFIANEF